MTAKVIVGAAVVSLAASQAAASTYDAFFAFGDSTVDSGWWSGALNGQCGAVTPPCATGSTNKNNLIASAIANGGTGAPVGVGLMNTQILASYFGLTANETLARPIAEPILHNKRAAGIRLRGS
jgi:hypothetical protein